MSDRANVPRRRRFRTLSAARGREGVSGQSLREALAELALLREENARLSAAAHEPPSLGRLVGRLRSLDRETYGAGDGDDVAQMLVDGVVLRESLLEVCRELERATAAVKARLDALEVEPLSGSRVGGG